ncbi:MAG: VWA domain-containing protein [Actinomycetales bacterium]|nr:VWA domain-containing protein [Actinomycetales bacterium]
MGRHADADAGLGPGQGPDRGRGWTWRSAAHQRGPLVALCAGGAVLLLLLVAAVQPRVVPGFVPWPFRQDCTPIPLEIVTAPEIRPAVTAIVEPVQGRELGSSCIAVEVRGQDPVQTIASATVLPTDRWPDLWIPDSSLWVARAENLSVAKVRTLATSPLVIAGSVETVTDLGWAGTPPPWATALSGVRQVAVPDLTSTAEGLSALLTIRRSAADVPDGSRALASALVAASRGEHDSDEEALTAIVEGGPDSPVVPTTEQKVLAANRASMATAVATVFPSDGSPSLDYPLLTVASSHWPEQHRRAVAAVLDQLTGSRADEIIRSHGFHDEKGTRPDGQDVPQQSNQLIPLYSATDLAALTDQINELAEPTRMLVLVDISTSMSARVDEDRDRISLVRDAAKGALTLLTDQDSMGAWAFASRLEDGRDWTELAPVDRLDASDGGGTHRQRLTDLFDGLPDSLRSGGTAVYDTVLGAVEHMREGYDAGSENVVVLLTDGTNEESRGISLDELEDQLEEASGGSEPIRIIAVGMGKGADMDALRRIAEATPNGSHHQATEPDELEEVLFDALSSRT